MISLASFKPLISYLVAPAFLEALVGRREGG